MKTFTASLLTMGCIAVAGLGSLLWHGKTPMVATPNASLPELMALPDGVAIELVAEGMESIGAADLELDPQGQPIVSVSNTLLRLGRGSTDDSGFAVLDGIEGIDDFCWVDGQGVVLVSGRRLLNVEESGAAPLLELPESDLRIAPAGVNGQVYLFGGRSRSLYRFDLPQPVNERQPRMVELLRCEQPITAVAGDGNLTFFAMGDTIYSMLPEQTLQAVFQADETVTKLALGQDSILFFATDKSVGVCGATGQGHAILQAANVRMAARGEALTLLIPGHGLAVLSPSSKLTGQFRKPPAAAPVPQTGKSSTRQIEPQPEPAARDATTVDAAVNDTNPAESIAASKAQLAIQRRIREAVVELEVTYSPPLWMPGMDDKSPLPTAMSLPSVRAAGVVVAREGLILTTARAVGAVGLLDLGRQRYVRPEDVDRSVAVGQLMVGRRTAINARLSDGTSLDSQIVAVDDNRDLALLRIRPTTKLTSLPVADVEPFREHSQVADQLAFVCDPYCRRAVRASRRYDDNASTYRYTTTDSLPGSPVVNQGGVIIGVHRGDTDGSAGASAIGSPDIYSAFYYRLKWRRDTDEGGKRIRDRILRVDPAGSGPYRTIGQALKVVNNGDTIELAPGRHEVDEYLWRLDEGVWIRGAGKRRTTLIGHLAFRKHKRDPTALLAYPLTVDGIEISDMTVECSVDGPVVNCRGFNGSLRGLRIENRSTSPKSQAVLFVDCAKSAMIDCSTHMGAERAIAVEVVEGTVRFERVATQSAWVSNRTLGYAVSFLDCRFDGSRLDSTIWLRDKTAGAVCGCRLQSPDTDSYQAAVTVDGGLDSSQVCRIVGNSVMTQRPSEIGIRIQNGKNVTVAGNRICCLNPRENVRSSLEFVGIGEQEWRTYDETEYGHAIYWALSEGPTEPTVVGNELIDAKLQIVDLRQHAIGRRTRGAIESANPFRSTVFAGPDSN